MSLLKKIDVRELMWKIMGGDVENPQDEIFLSSRYTRFGTEKEKLEIGNFVSTDGEDSSKLYEVVKIKKNKAYVKEIGTIKYNEILRNHRKKQKLREISEYSLDPKESKINVVLNGGFA